MTALFRGDYVSTRIALAATALALLVRVAYVTVQTVTPVFDVAFVGGDAVLYANIASGIADGHGMQFGGRPTAYVSPGYPIFLAALLRIGADPLAVGLVQAVLGALTVLCACVTVFELARPAERRLAVAITGLAAAVYPHLVQWTGYMLTETLFVALVAVAIALMVRALHDRQPALAALAGIAGGAAAVTRPPFLAVVAVIVIWAFRETLRGRMPMAVPLSFAAAAAVLPGAWASRNAIELGAPVVTSTESGFVFYQGNSRASTGGSRGYVEPPDFVPIDPPVPMSEVDKDRFYLEIALADIADDPVRTVVRWPAKLWNMWRPAYADASPRNLAVTTGTYVPTLLFGVIGAVVLFRRIGLASAPVPLLILLTWVVIHVIVTGMIRFRLASELVLLEAAPFGLLYVRDLLRRGR